MDFETALKREAVLQSQLGFAHDYREGVAAFMAKRVPVYKDR
jgi:2-(1,2-epoxy-1,2-dihydrophenyl)acetyl-CoA isomerase